MIPHRDDPIDDGVLRRASDAIEAGSSFRAAYEQLLLDVDDAAADRMMQIQREARGTWLLLLRVPAPDGARASALFIGNSLSGAHTPLAHYGFDVTLFDTSVERLRFAALRNAALVPSSTAKTATVLASGERRLPFDDAHFDLVIQEDGLPSLGHGWRHDLDELRRVCRVQLVLIADNRFAYKRSTGRRGDFDVPSPWRYARTIAARSHERTLVGYRRVLRHADFAAPESFALYPHAREFTFLVGLDRELPRLEVGPRERRNRWKILADSMGLFPWLAPSFALLTARKSHAATAPRVERVLESLAANIGEPRPQVEHLVATRGNSAVLLTRAEDQGERGAWCVHVGFSGAERVQLRTHFETLQDITREHRACPVPEPLFEGELDGLYLTCERRAQGVTATQRTGQWTAARRTFEDLSAMLANLVIAPSRALDEAEFEVWITRRVELVASKASSNATRATLARMLAQAREALIGERVPRVIQHSDLRSKHVQVQLDGRVTALLDWGSAQRGDLPYFDLLHYVAHERKQADGLSPARMWQLVRERVELRDFERAALADYAERLGLSDRFCRGIEALYPVLVAAMVEAHWDYSRPRWLESQFGL